MRAMASRRNTHAHVLINRQRLGPGAVVLMMSTAMAALSVLLCTSSRQVPEQQQVRDGHGLGGSVGSSLPVDAFKDLKLVSRGG